MLQFKSCFDRCHFRGIAALTLAGVLLRLWMIGAKGLWYDEAATALMARAPFSEIVRFHWRAPFEHPPLWILLMGAWSRIFGQSESALRLPSALAGVLIIPLFWNMWGKVWPGDQTGRLLAVGLIVLSPLLALYSQEARMYSLATLLAVISVYLWMSMAMQARWATWMAFVLVNWAMLGLHYYSLLLLGAETVFLLALAAFGRRPSVKMVLGLGISILPTVLWLGLAPGSRTTLAAVLAQTSKSGANWSAFLDRFWRELTFGAVVWLPREGVVGYLLVPLFLAGLVEAVRSGPARSMTRSTFGTLPWGWFFAAIVLVPLLVSLLFSNRIATRYLLFVSPFFYAILALGLRAIWQRTRLLGAAGLFLTSLIAVWGLVYYFGSYQKSGYRNMAAYLTARAGWEDAVLLESPRQHLLAKYYLPPDLPVFPMPPVALPAYWPVTAPPIVPEAVDDELKAIASSHSHVWLILAGQNEVDPGEFVHNYLTAISYEEGCREWLDVRLCRFTAPSATFIVVSRPMRVEFQGELMLRGVDVALARQNANQRYVFVTLYWTAKAKPSADYKVTLRLLDREGRLISQGDNFPIGPLLPPTTWNTGDNKPGYMALEVPRSLARGDYDLVVGLYSPVTPELLPFSDTTGVKPGLLELARVRVDDAIQVQSMP
jgi:uncharacterized membrane protein